MHHRNAMYLEPLTVYREYIQNSVDAIDEAIDQGLLEDTSKSNIEINVDVAERKIVIRDNGAGISMENQKHIFESFFQTEQSHARAEGGLGFGLDITRQLVLLVNGEIVCESDPVEGTVFTVTIPVKI